MKTRINTRRRSHNASIAAPADISSETLESRQLMSADFNVAAAAMATDSDLEAEQAAAHRLSLALEGGASQHSALFQDATQAQLLAPAGQIQGRSPQFQWSAVDGAVRYEIWVQQLETNQRVLYSDRLTGTSATTNVELPDGNYRWWIRAYDSVGRAGSWSFSADFSVSAQSLELPVPQNPSGQISSVRPQFQWSSANGASRYELWVISRDTNQRVLHGDQITGNSAQGNIDLPAGSYRWWVRAFDAQGNASQWSNSTDFTIVASQQGVTTPTAVSPIGSVNSSTPRFEWTVVNGAVRYELWVTNNDSRQRVIHSDSLTSNAATISNGLAQGNYTWWVRAFDSADRATSWSSPAAFRIEAEQQSGGGAIAQLIGPRGSVNSGTPQFEWSEVRGAVRYELWVTSIDSNQRVLYSNQLTGTTASISQGQLSDGNYRWWVRGFDAAGRASQWSAPADFTIRSGGGDDQYENNDSVNQAADLGSLTQVTRIDNLSLADGEDWFTFTMNGAGTSQDYVSITFDHSRGDIDLKLYDSNGNLVLVSDSTNSQEVVALNGLSAGRYFVHVYGYDGTTNPSYKLEINPGDSGGGGTTDSAYRTLYVNFDGVRLSRQDLERYSQGRWGYIDLLDEERDGVSVNAFMAASGSREQAIRDIMALLQQDLATYGITVQRITGGAVEGHGASTIFIGPTNQRQIAERQASGIACDIDRGNDNPTDIAFVMDAPSGATYQNMVLTMADTILHESGHTWGLHHVETIANGTLQPESMGFTYTVNQRGIRLTEMANTSFLDITFHEYMDQGLIPGVSETQNSHQIMAAAFGSSSRPQNQSLALVDLSLAGVFSVQTTNSNDAIAVSRLAGGQIRIDINGSRHIVSSDLAEIRIYTNGQAGGTIAVAGELADRVSVIAGSIGTMRAQKVGEEIADIWNGSRVVDYGCDEHGASGDRHDDGHDDGASDGEGLYNSSAAVMAARQSQFSQSSELDRSALLVLMEEDLNNHTSDSAAFSNESGDLGEWVRLDAYFAQAAESGVETNHNSMDLFEDLLVILNV